MTSAGRIAAEAETDRKPIKLALQGGGAHGAFTWGVLDALLADERVEIVALSGTSAGAMNAVVLADGLCSDGEAGARERLAHFWRAVARAGRLSPIQRTLFDQLSGNWSLDHSPGYHWAGMMSRFYAPGDWNPLAINPLREILCELIDFERARRCEALDLYIGATAVRSGRVRVFKRAEVSVDVVLASACLPTLYQPVEIDGEYYWDGGFSGNPPLFPLRAGPCKDLVVVQINPIECDQVPRTAAQIHDRVNAITFNQPLLAELRAIDFVHRLLEQGRLDPGEYSDLRVHLIESAAAMKPLGASSKLNAEWAFLRHLRELGRTAAGDWLERHHAALGRHSTVDLRAMFGG